MVAISLKNIDKIYDKKVTAVSDFNLEIEDKEFIVFVGPSGCGKSTTLRMIAGLEDISRGEFIMDGHLMNDVAPKNRHIAMVFQNYALYPHLSVYDNMAFGLKLRKMNKKEIKERIDKAAHILGLTDYLQRKPRELSGGQRQRVALGRAIVREAKLFLMDEPLSNLDAKLRVQMRAEISKLHQELNTTMIYVTHDQTEAMTMATRIVIMKDGVIQQVGTPKDVYENPINLFVGSFIGSPPMNFITGELRGNQFIAPGTQLTVPEGKLKMLNGRPDGPITLGIRPEDMHDEPLFLSAAPENTVHCEVLVAELTGAEYMLHTTIGGQNVIARVNARTQYQLHAKIELGLDLSKAHLFDPVTELSLTSKV